MDWDWKAHPLRLDPRRGYHLCEPCWNLRHFDPAYEVNGVKYPKVANCLISKWKGAGGCGCPCLEPIPKKVRFTGAGQEKLFDDPEAEEVRHQDE
jgi:hypothetical protein